MPARPAPSSPAPASSLSPVRLLHVGSGFRPWRKGGLVAYVEDLIDEQTRRGHEVSYFFSGRQYPYLSGPRLRRWKRGTVAMLEVVNSPLYDHGRRPDLELSEPRIERMFERLIRELRPDVVHLQELAGLPSSLLDVVRHSGVPAILTLQDYFLLCSTFRLLDADGRVCLRLEIGADCVATTMADPRAPGLLLEATLRHDAASLPLLRKLNPDLVDRRMAPTARAVARRSLPKQTPPNSSGDPASAFQRRRDLNLRRLNRTDRLVAMSGRVAEIYALLGVDEARLRTAQLTLGHIEHLRPRVLEREGPVTFGTLSGLESRAKGAELLLRAMRLLQAGPAAGRFRLLVFGYVDPAVVEEAEHLAGVELRGFYHPAELDALLDEVDVGIIPSVWEEAYGYVGPELLAKGIPVIANAIGGIVEYAREGETGWLNHSRSAEELAEIMTRVVKRPEEVRELSAKVRAARDRIVIPLARHAEEMEEIYREVIN